MKKAIPGIDKVGMAFLCSMLTIIRQTISCCRDLGEVIP